jgi:hypothetical protein
MAIAAGGGVRRHMVEAQSPPDTGPAVVTAGILVTPVTLHAVIQRGIVESRPVTGGAPVGGTGVRVVSRVSGSGICQRPVAGRAARETAPAAIVESLECLRRQSKEQGQDKAGRNGE